ncbi:MAG: hypothetical protein ACTSPI_16545, partial [Candidatus Heimdallarchaeaceae archaeon]
MKKLNLNIKIRVVLIAILIMPYPLTQYFVEGIGNKIMHEDQTDRRIDVDQLVKPKIVHSIDTNPSTNLERKRELPIEQPSQSAIEYNTLPKFYYGTYNTYTTLSSVPTLINKGDTFDVTSTTKFSLGTLYPVDKGTLYWYDLNVLKEDKGSYSQSIGANTIAVEFSLLAPANYTAVSFDVSSLSDLTGDELNVYLTSDLNNYATNYKAKTALSFKYYNSQTGVSSIFAFWDNPITTQVDNTLQAGVSYYIVIEGDSTVNVQASEDSTEKNDNTVYIYSSGSWVEQSGLDAQLSVYTGSKLTEITTTTGSTTITYDSSTSTFKNHRIVAFYYDTSGMFDLSSASKEFTVIDETAPEYLTLTTPLSIEYTDVAELSATVENYYNLPLSDIAVSFYYSEDNVTWAYIEDVLTDSNGIALSHHTSNKASGYYYYKAEASTITDYSSTECKKEQVIVDVPLIQTIYGNRTGYYNQETFKVKVRLIDNDNQPIEGQMVFIYVDGKTFQYDVTDSDGYAYSTVYSVAWNAGYYTNKYWITIDLDTSFYSFQATTYGDIEVLKGDLTIESPPSVEFCWAEPVNFTVKFTDNQGYYVPNLSYETVLYNITSGTSISLGFSQTNDTEYRETYFPVYIFNPGDYQIIIRVNVKNYNYIEQTIDIT